MEASKRYRIYDLNRIMGNEQHLSLHKTELKGWDSNDFETEQEAIQYLIDKGMNYEEYLILPSVYIS